jgi:predicted ATPase
VLESQCPETGETQPEILAQHYTEAGLTEQALGYWQRAGQRALAQSANAEAIRHLTTGLALLTTLTDTAARAAQESLLLTTLGPALMATQGYASPEEGHTYALARALAQQVEETPQLAQVFFGLWVFYHARAEHSIGRELSEQFLTLAYRVQDPALLLVGHQMVGQSVYCLGELARARELFEQALTYYDPQQHRALALLYVTDPIVASLAWLSFTLWLLGYPDQGQQQNRAALTLAHALGHSLTLGSALAWAAFFYCLRGDGQATYEQAEAAVRLSTDKGLPFRVAMGTILRGWALAALGEREEGVARLRQGLEGWRATGAAISWSYYLGSLADAYARGAHAGEGLAVLFEALTCVDTTGERYAEAELHRLKGKLLLKQTVPDAQQAEVCLQQALAITRRQQAKSWELRAAMSLSRLWQQEGKRHDARELLAPIYSWFTEGFDTADLQDAKALLETLS